ncbi:MAG: YitT family protein [Oscillospiraceae bacterium]|nr:YitT family protein [Oscillospiraceae bacterium]
MGKGKYTARSIIVRCLVIMVGVIITAYGAVAFILANLGSDPVTAFVQGLGKVLNLSFGNAMNVFNVVFFVIILIFNRKTIGIGTVLYTFTLGVFCNILMPWIVAIIGEEPTMVARIILIVTGTIALGVGLGFYQSAEFGCGPSDAFNQTMAKKLKLELRWWRIIFDVIMVIGALIMGGVVHVGTLVGMFLVGPVLGPVLNKMAPIVNKWAGNEDIVHEAI